MMISPRTNDSNPTKEAGLGSSSRPLDLPLFVVPFPDLPKSVEVPTSSGSGSKKRARQAAAADPVVPLLFSSSPSSPSYSPRASRRVSQVSASAPISIPETHIRRTPSELQLVADTLHAEYKDVCMYSRLVSGMHAQMQHRCQESGSPEVHPLSAKSMQGVINTKYAKDEELLVDEPQQYHQEHHLQLQYLQPHQVQHEDSADQGEEDDDEWCMSYSPIDEETPSQIGSSSSSPGCDGSASYGFPSSSRHTSNDSIWMSLLPEIESDCLEDDCVFSMEL